MNLRVTLPNINMSASSHSETDTRIILHVFSCVHNSLKGVYVRTNDTDVVAIYSNVPVSVVSGVGFNTGFISANAIAAYIGLKRCKELLFLHSISGCDYTSSFFHVGKMKFWDVWLNNSVFSQTFLLYSISPTLPLAEGNLKLIESFLVSLYVTESDISPSVDVARYQIFKYRGNSGIRSLTPTYTGCFDPTYS